MSVSNLHSFNAIYLLNTRRYSIILILLKLSVNFWSMSIQNQPTSPQTYCKCLIFVRFLSPLVQDFFSPLKVYNNIFRFCNRCFRMRKFPKSIGAILELFCIYDSSLIIVLKKCFVLTAFDKKYFPDGALFLLTTWKQTWSVIFHKWV